MHATLGTIDTAPVHNGHGASRDEYSERAYQAGARYLAAVDEILGTVRAGREDHTLYC
ncbi:hypothetical protein [Arthrobacter caoxuetaonis]|uniref:hypothetical protein n=1 Tax=Arthrobacter caoxuetaonis TaxID=2886935 RepID=UPI001D1496DC|nr:hypothetical protein [Arthrobacter caoxuetaonis]MCC3281946.1 hypothetical protein [Arthrobacter caoxuetaonis]MCC3283015.1 hypothetical protein [Arthrobacter caoxuetaonis]